MSSKPILIEIDGPEYAGKTTLLSNLKEFKTKDGFEFLSDFEFKKLPGESYLGDLIGPAIKTYKEWTPITSIGGFLLNQGDAFKNFARDGKNVITDRGISSAIVYTGVLQKAFDESRPLMREGIAALVNYVVENFDYHRIILTLSYDEFARRKAKRDQVEFNKDDIYDNASKDKINLMLNAYADFEIREDNQWDLINSPFTFRGLGDKVDVIKTDGLSEEQVLREVIDVIRTIRN